MPVGVALFMFGVGHAHTPERQLLGIALAFSAGTFLCISTSDLLPELQFHAHDRVKLSTALLLGLAVAAAIVLVESSTHDHGGHEHHHAGEQADAPRAGRISPPLPYPSVPSPRSARMRLTSPITSLMTS